MQQALVQWTVLPRTHHQMAFANERITPKIAEVRAVALDELPLGVTDKVLKRKLREALDAEAGGRPTHKRSA